MKRPWAILTAIALIALGASPLACSSGQTKEEDPWSDNSDKDDTVEFDKKLRAKHLKEKEHQAQIAALARKHGNTEVANSIDASAGPVASSGDNCPPSYDDGYRCTCTPKKAPAWVARADGPAWKDKDGNLLAAVKKDGVSDISIAVGSSTSRAALKIAALQQGAPVNAKGYPKKKLSSRVVGAENIAAYLPGPKQLVVLVRVRTDGWQPNPTVLKARCPKPQKANYSCSCGSGSSPDWLYREVWRAADGFIYSVGVAPESGDHTARRTKSRAMASLGRYLAGFSMTSKPLGKGREFKGMARSDLDSSKIQEVVTLPQADGGLAILMRLWVGP